MSAILQYFHCKCCFEDKPADVSPKEWARLSVGWTEAGVQVWCDRCERNVVHLDFQGLKVGLVEG